MHTRLKITDGKGLNLKFPNGITLSVQIGGGNYSDNYDFPIGPINRSDPLPSSGRAEIAVWPAEGEWVNFGHDTVAGYVPVEDILSLIPMLTALPDLAGTERIEVALADFINKQR